MDVDAIHVATIEQPTKWQTDNHESACPPQNNGGGGDFRVDGLFVQRFGRSDQGDSGQQSDKQHREVTPPPENMAERTSITTRYELAHHDRGVIRGTTSTAVSTFSEGNYGLVLSLLDGFEGAANGVADSFSAVAETAAQEGFAEVAVSARAGEAECTALANAGVALRDAASLARDGEQEIANQELASAQSFIETADTEGQDVLSPSEVEDRV